MGALTAGPVLFARYAYGPNRLDYCGPAAADELFHEASRPSSPDGALRQLARGFEGAWPYLELIARANGIADPLDAQVVDAYWIGNALLERVTPGLLAESLRTRFRPRLPARDWHWLATKPADGALPVHAFHVLDVFPQVGLLRSGSNSGGLGVMDSCRVRWGRVLERQGDALVTSVVPLAIADGKLRLDPPRVELVTAWRDGAGFIGAVGPGDVISIHWNWACEVLDRDRLQALMRWTRREIGIANRTM